MKNKSHSFKDLVVWNKSNDLVILVYKLTNEFPKQEAFGITSQIKRAAVSIPSNIAEGSMRGTKKDFMHFLTISLGSAAELQTQLILARKLNFGKEKDYNDIDNLLDEITKMLYKLRSSIN